MFTTVLAAFPHSLDTNYNNSSFNHITMSTSFFDCAEQLSNAEIPKDHVPGLTTYDLDKRDECDQKSMETDQSWHSETASFKDERVRVAELRDLLSNELLDESSHAFSEIIPNIKTKIVECEHRLQQLGDPRSTSLQQKVHLDKISRQFQQLLSQAVKGQYTNRDFFRPNPNSGEPRRLRTSIQVLNDQFAKKMFEKGHRRDISVGPDGLPTPLQPGYSYESIFNNSVEDDPEKVTRAGYLVIIGDLMNNNRGTELPGAVDTRLVRELFCDQSQKWLRIAEEHLEQALGLVANNLKEILHYAASDDVTANKIYLHWIEPRMDKKKKKLMKRLRQLIAPYEQCHPITYNLEYLELVENIRRRNQEAVSRGQIQPDPNICGFDLAASDLLNSMEAYYKVSVRTFVDNIAILAVEMTLISRLDEIFTPSDITFMETEMLDLLASEAEINQRKRVELTESKANLEKALRLCRSYAAQTPLGMFSTPLPSRILKSSFVSFVVCFIYSTC
jgi:hypothetical protein